MIPSALITTNERQSVKPHALSSRWRNRAKASLYKDWVDGDEGYPGVIGECFEQNDSRVPKAAFRHGIANLKQHCVGSDQLCVLALEAIRDGFRLGVMFIRYRRKGDGK